MISFKRTSLFAGMVLVTSVAMAQSANSELSTSGANPATGGTPTTNMTHNGGNMTAAERAEMKKQKAEAKMNKRTNDATSPTSGSSTNANATGTSAPISVTAPAQNPNNPHAQPVPGAQNNQLYQGK